MINTFTIHSLTCDACARTLGIDQDGHAFSSRSKLGEEAGRQGWALGTEHDFCDDCRRRPASGRFDD